MILLIDNYDSFVHNLARYVQELGCDAIVRRHDSLSTDDVAALAPSHIIISPGPCTPSEAGISTSVVERFGATTPILGVCLGHQCIASAYGGNVVTAANPMHGKTAEVHHDGSGIFNGIPTPFTAARYHSLAVDEGSLAPALRVSARDGDGEIMAVQHREHPVYGVQFHPESAATEYGYWIMANFLGVSHDDDLPVAADMQRRGAAQ
jgi:anthranilate synthase/aminodeoxychorismate synthase-like glutamine amidotransferase